MKRIYVVGVGMTKFYTPGTVTYDYPKLVHEAITTALQDAKLNKSAVDQVCVGSISDDLTCGQKIMDELSMSGIPIYIINKHQYPDSTALFMAKQLIEDGPSNCVLAVGFENADKRSSKPNDRTFSESQCCPTSDGAAAAILASEDFVYAHGLQSKAVEILAMEKVTDISTTYEDVRRVGYDMTKKAAEKLFQKMNISPKDVDVVELHDCFLTNELTTYEALGLCDVGESVDTRNNAKGRRFVVNPSGGPILRGHPLRATGIAQCVELCWQLRNKSRNRQVPNAKIALQHNISLGGSVVLGLYKLGFPACASSEDSDSSAIQEDTKFTTTVNFQVDNLTDKSIAGMIAIGNIENSGICVQNGSLTMGTKVELSKDNVVSQARDFLRNYVLKNSTPTSKDDLYEGQYRGNQLFLENIFSVENIIRSKL